MKKVNLIFMLHYDLCIGYKIRYRSCPVQVDWLHSLEYSLHRAKNKAAHSFLVE